MEVILYEKVNGECPIKDFILSVNSKMRAKIARNIDVLAEFNINLREPFVKMVEDGIFELRTQAEGDISRIFYFFYHDNKIILTNGFIKKTQKTPRKFIEIAKNYRDDYKRRNA